MDIKPPSDSLIQNPSFQYFEVSTTSPDGLLKAFQAARPQVVIHSAAVIPPLSERYGRRLEKVMFEVNVEGTRHALDAASQSGCSGFVYTSSCCAVTDDMSVPYINIDERWPVSPVSSIYGESKVRGQVGDLTALITSLGPSRGASARSLKQIHVYMRAAPISLVRQRRHAASSTNTRLSRQARDTLGCWRWHQSLGCNICRQCG